MNRQNGSIPSLKNNERNKRNRPNEKNKVNNINRTTTNRNKNVNMSNNLKRESNVVLKSKLVRNFLNLLIDVKIYHWKTYSYAEHKATDELYASLNENIDKFVEVMLGKNGKRLDMKEKKIKIIDPNGKNEFLVMMRDYRELIERDIDKYISMNSNTDLSSIRDDILADINKFMYLMTLR